MTPQQFLKQELTALAAKFPHIQIRYGFDTMIDTHIVQLDPVQEYYHNEALDAAWIPVAMAFDEQFEDAISFISSDSTLRLESVEMEWNIPVSANSNLSFYNEIVALFLQPNSIKYQFPGVGFYKKEETGLATIHHGDVVIKSGVSVYTSFFHPSNVGQSIVTIQKQELAQPEEGGNTQYAMAA